MPKLSVVKTGVSAVPTPSRQRVVTRLIFSRATHAWPENDAVALVEVAPCCGVNVAGLSPSRLASNSSAPAKVDLKQAQLSFGLGLGKRVRVALRSEA